MRQRKLSWVILEGMCVVLLTALLLLNPAATSAQTPAFRDLRPARSLETSTADWPVVALKRSPGAYEYPVHLTDAGDGSGRLFVVEKRGAIRMIRNGHLLATPFLDISDRVNSTCNECGLLSVAFPPDFESGRYVFVYYTANEDVAEPEPSDNGNDSGNDTVIARFRLGSNPNRADPSSEERILVRNQPFVNHNGGMIAFGPDGYLYAGMGDGGGRDDPLGSGQRPNTILGKMLRLEVTSTGGYEIPPDNPFAHSSTHLPEIWALGLRNPWRFSFDKWLGDLYIADVGQRTYEEINHQPATSAGGENYGWSIMEGAHCFDTTQCSQAGLTLPIHEYEHTEPPCSSITGGAVYRGSQVAWRGVYFFADYCSGRIFGLRKTAGAWESAALLDTEIWITSFGEDGAGELYIAGRDTNSGSQSPGVVYQLTLTGSHSLFLPSILNTANN